MVGTRYRVVSLLGRGGMGEVYRADDLKLGQAVALKFLPAALERDSNRLERFLNEVRVALRVSHPNVCRVYDVGDVEGRHFISMEYVDGEDLASLLRRIGRFPEDRAERVAGQLCAGLAAAHDRGVLHRDLKPANVMIDGQGRVKITDFGLSSVAERVEGAEARAGTPAYMSPEQREGREVTARSDVYSLGLVLYELFTGERAFSGDTAAEVARQQSDATPVSMTSRVDSLDPAIERIVGRCLEIEPGERPASALAVAAALPGGDPLAAALAAGEIPSPEMVANAGDTAGMRPFVALACAVGTLAIWLALAGAGDGGRAATPAEPPEKLAIRAEQLLESVGSDRALHSEWGLDTNTVYLHAVAEASQAPDRWNGLTDDRTPGNFFWRRWSPVRLVSSDLHRAAPLLADPPQTHPGSATVVLDSYGRLLRLDVVPSPSLPDGEMEFDSIRRLLFEASELDPTRFTSGPLAVPPPSYCDRTAAWIGTLPGGSEAPVTVQIGTHRGHAVHFSIVWDWGEPASPTTTDMPLPFLLVQLVLMAASAALAVRNLRMGRGDLRGAAYLSLVMLAINVAEAILNIRVGQTGLATLAYELTQGEALAHSLLHAVSMGTSYLAIEPYARRLWPRSLVSWARLIDGRLRDPLIGRDILAGGVGGAAIVVSGGLILFALPMALGIGSLPPVFAGGSALFVTDTRGALYGVVLAAAAAALAGMGQFVFLVVGRFLLRNRWAAALFSTIPATVLLSGMFEPFLPSAYGALAGFVGAAIIAFLLIRFGLVAALTARFVNLVIVFLPLTLDITSWRADTAAVSFFCIAALLAYGTWIAMGGRSLLRDPLRDTPSGV